jgi:adenylosuccinate lyase
MRRHGIVDAYEQLKELTRGRRITREILSDFIESADLPADVRARLLALRPADYIGLAATLARRI